MSKKDQKILKNKYLVVPRTLVFLFYEDEILLILGAKNKKLWSGLFNGVGGHIEKGESIVDAAYRELAEETGVQNITLSLKAIISIDVDPEIGINMFVFVGFVDKKNVSSSVEGDLKWVKLDEISQYPLVEDLYLLIPKIAAKNDQILYGHYYYIDDKLNMEFKP